MKTFVKIVGVAAGFALLFLFDVISLNFVQDAEAIAGVRRRTARRTAVIVGSSSAAAASASQQQVAAANAETAAAQQEAAAANAKAEAYKQQATAPAPTAMVASLPAGCVTAGQIFQCGTVYYKAYMSGSQIVYGVVPGP
jgi:hypothetical protein